MDEWIGLGLQKVRTSTTAQPESISRKDMRIRYLLITDLLKNWQTDRYKSTKYKVKLFRLYFYPFCCCSAAAGAAGAAAAI